MVSPVGDGGSLGLKEIDEVGVGPSWVRGPTRTSSLETGPMFCGDWTVTMQGGPTLKPCPSEPIPSNNGKILSTRPAVAGTLELSPREGVAAEARAG